MSILKPEDLQFLLYKKVALRFQGKNFQDQFVKDGEISGDAYSLSDPKFWHPPDEAKTEKFEKEFKELIRRVFVAFTVVHNFEGSFLLLKDLDNARRPVSYARAYKPPFLTVGAFTPFSLDQVAAQVDVTRELIVNQLGYYNDRPNDEVLDKVVDHIANKLLLEIVQMRKESNCHIADILRDSRDLALRKEVQERMERRRAKRSSNTGLPDF